MSPVSLFFLDSTVTLAPTAPSFCTRRLAVRSSADERRIRDRDASVPFLSGPYYTPIASCADAPILRGSFGRESQRSIVLFECVACDDALIADLRINGER
jgi:hypothetical protein